MRAIDRHDAQLSDLHARVTEHRESLYEASRAISQEMAPGDDGYATPSRLRVLYRTWLAILLAGQGEPVYTPEAVVSALCVDLNARAPRKALDVHQMDYQDRLPGPVTTVISATWLDNPGRLEVTLANGQTFTLTARTGAID